MYIINISTSNFPYFHHFLDCITGTTKLSVDLIVPCTLFFLPRAVHTGSVGVHHQLCVFHISVPRSSLLLTGGPNLSQNDGSSTVQEQE